VRLNVHAFFPAGGDDGLGVSLTLNPNFKAKKPEGRSKNFTGLNVGWNNKYFQTLDVNGTGTVCVRIRCEHIHVGSCSDMESMIELLRSSHSSGYECVCVGGHILLSAR
jgi:hypothetical protein